jgi:hypothetical protein
MSTNSQGWLQCPIGEWQKLSSFLRFQRRVVLAIQAAVVVVALAVIGFGVWQGVSALASTTPANPQGCPPCHSTMPTTPVMKDAIVPSSPKE